MDGDSTTRLMKIDPSLLTFSWFPHEQISKAVDLQDELEFRVVSGFPLLLCVGLRPAGLKVHWKIPLLT